MRSYLAFDMRHVLPVDGGYLDQSRSFVAACEIIDDERGRLERMKEAKREQDSRAAQARAKQTGARRR